MSTKPRDYKPERPTCATKSLLYTQAYEATAKDAPRGPGAGTHHGVRTDRIVDAGKVSLRYQGKLFHLGVGREHIAKDITILVADNAATVIQTSSGEILGEYRLDATKNYQPKKRPLTPKRKSPRQKPGTNLDERCHETCMNHVPHHHTWSG